MIKVCCSICKREIKEEQVINGSTPWVFAHTGIVSLAIIMVQESKSASNETVICHSCAAALLKATLEKEKERTIIKGD